MEIRIGRVPGGVLRHDLDDNATVLDALIKAGIDLTPGETINLNGSPISADDAAKTILSTGATILLTKQVKGNMPIVVGVGRVPGRVHEVALLDDATTVRDALLAANITLVAGETVVVNGDSDVTVEDDVEEGATVLVTKQVKGNF